MKKIDWKLLIVTSSIFLIPLVLILIYYGQLPAVLYTHFGIDSQAIEISDKWIALVLTPILLVVVHLSLCIGLDMTKSGRLPVVKVVKWVIPIFTTLETVLILVYNAGNQIDVRRLVVALLALIYLLLGNYLPKDVAGMTDSKTLMDRKKTAYLFISGAFALLLSLFFAPTVSLVVGIVFIVLVISWSICVGVKNYRSTSNRL